MATLVTHSPLKGAVLPDDTPKPETKKFISLKWKVLLLSSLILFAIVTSFCAISYLSLVDHFENQSDSQHQRYIQEVEGLIEQTSQSLHQFAGTIPFLKGMDTGLLASDGEAILKAFDQHWGLLQLHNGIDLVRFYNTSNRLLARWGIAESEVPDSDALLKWIRDVNSREQPISPISCAERCLQYAVEPLLIAGKSAGAVVIGTSLVDSILGFKRISGADIGLLIGNDSGVPKGGTTHLPNWNVHVAALTNSKINLAVLHKVAQKYPDLHSLENGIKIADGTSYRQIRLLPLSRVNANDKSQLVVITDITSTVKAIRKSTRQNIAIGLLGLLLSELLLFVILSKPLSRLRHIVFTLPLLAGSTFEYFRLTLHRAGKITRTNDEIDLLAETVVILSYQLEKLEDQVTDHTNILTQQMYDLSKERNFIAHLLDTAQVIVLTQNTSGEIITLNTYGATLTHYRESDLHGKPFIDLLSPQGDLRDLSAHLLELRLDQREQLRHEAVTLCKDGSVRHIVWLHSRLTQHSEGDPAILSVGLDITEHKRVEGRLAWLADHDPLTNLFNRRRFHEELERMLNLASRYQYPGALLFFDLDQFKYINDTSGHQAGDNFLKMVANILTHIVRTTDVIARLGGDEFAVILPVTSVDGAISVAKKILASLNKAELTVQGRTHKASASIGIALFPQHGNDVSELLAAADLAMYQAKETGRNGWHVFSDKDLSLERMHNLIYWKEKIEQALLDDRFILYFQPIMDVRNKTITHYEVLLRMLDEDGTVLTPAAFISAAEHTGLIHAIDHMVLRKAIAQAAEIFHRGRRICFSINLSALAFNDPELLPVMAEMLAEHDADPTSFIFEITETAALADLNAARKLMESIRALGCSFALDDFGVGFSSFYYIRQLPIDYVKIDGSFIQNLADNPDDQILVKALCDVAKGFGKKTTAEFVENAATLTLLEKMQVDYAQGYHIGRPAPAYETFFQGFWEVIP